MNKLFTLTRETVFTSLCPWGHDQFCTALQSTKMITTTKQNSKQLINLSVVTDSAYYAFEVNQWILKMLGVWPHTLTGSFIEKLLAYLLIIICSLLLAFIIVPGSLFTYIVVKDPAVRLKLTGPLSFCITAIAKYILLILRRKYIAVSINHIIMDWNINSKMCERKIMLNYAKYGRYGTIISAMFMYGGALFFAGILPHISVNDKNEKNITIRPLAYPSYYMWFDSQKSPTYEIIVLVHCCCAFVMHSITCASCGLLCTFVMHATGQLELLIVWLDDLVDGKQRKESTTERLSQIISQHVRILG